MLYDVYENTIGMIEELEKHEDHGKSAGHSGLLSHVIPPDRKKEKQDVSLPALLHLRPTDTGNSAATSTTISTITNPATHHHYNYNCQSHCHLYYTTNTTWQLMHACHGARRHPIIVKYLRVSK